MCGRKTLSKDIASIIEEMDIEEWEAHDYKPNYNIAPTDFSPVIIKAVSYTHLRAHETSLHLVCRLLLEKKNHIQITP